MLIMEKLAAKAEQLCEHRTSNLAENVFCRLCKYNLGKRMNLMSRGTGGHAHYQEFVLSPEPEKLGSNPGQARAAGGRGHEAAMWSVETWRREGTGGGAQKSAGIWNVRSSSDAEWPAMRKRRGAEEQHGEEGERWRKEEVC
ncbi:hypothetical protein quinque_012115 [Culex quinquefasciatus]